MSVHKPLTAREVHDAHLEQASGFHRVFTGNAFQGHVHRPRRRRSWWRAFVAFLSAPSPWEPGR